MDIINKDGILFSLDILIRAGCAIAIMYFISNIWVSVRRGYVFIYGKVATKKDEPLGYWIGIACWIGASCVLFIVVLRGM